MSSNVEVSNDTVNQDLSYRNAQCLAGTRKVQGEAVGYLLSSVSVLCHKPLCIHKAVRSGTAEMEELPTKQRTGYSPQSGIASKGRLQCSSRWTQLEGEVTLGLIEI